MIGVDPDAQGIGLGRALVLAGLDHLARIRRCPNGVLYVAAANTPAVGLYESLGFTVHRTDTALVLERLVSTRYGATRAELRRVARRRGARPGTAPTRCGRR